jgi:hypothetical protein
MPNVIAVEVQNLEQPVGLEVDHSVQDGGLVLGELPGSGVTVDESAIELAALGSWAVPQGPHVRPNRAGLRLNPLP